MHKSEIDTQGMDFLQSVPRRVVTVYLPLDRLAPSLLRGRSSTLATPIGSQCSGISESPESIFSRTVVGDVIRFLREAAQ